MSATKIALGFFVVISMALMPIFWTFSKTVESEQTRIFEAYEWKRLLAVINESSDPGCVRGDMAQDLIDNKRLVGLMKAQVAVVLGNPDESHVGRWLYSVGQCGFDWRLSFLVIRFDLNEKATYAGID